MQGRAGKGIKAGIFNDKTGELVGLKLVNDENDIMIITTGGTIIRMHADAITRIGRNTRGVKVMNVKESEVATVDVTERDDEAEVEAPEETELSAEALAEMQQEAAKEAAETEETEETAETAEQSESSEE